MHLICGDVAIVVVVPVIRNSGIIPSRHRRLVLTTITDRGRIYLYKSSRFRENDWAEQVLSQYKSFPANLLGPVASRKPVVFEETYWAQSFPSSKSFSGNVLGPVVFDIYLGQ